MVATAVEPPIPTVALTGAAVASVGGEEEGRTRGLKLSPPQVLSMLGLWKRWRWWRGSLLQEKGMKLIKKGGGVYIEQLWKVKGLVK